jgi:hypothetical protein
MRVGNDLQSKALLALEEVCAECRYAKPPRTHAVRFALAYLWSHSTGSAEPFVSFWRQLHNWNDLMRWRQADEALGQIYGAVGAPTANRHDLSMEMWRLAQERHEASRA